MNTTLIGRVGYPFKLNVQNSYDAHNERFVYEVTAYGKVKRACRLSDQFETEVEGLVFSPTLTTVDPSMLPSLIDEAMTTLDQRMVVDA